MKPLQCLGYTKDHRRCRLDRINEKTCKIHRNYYTNWLVKHPINIHYISQRKINEIIFQLESGNIVINKEYVKANVRFYEHDKYLFLINHAKINPLWSTEVFQSYLETSLDTSILISTETCIEALRYLFKKENWELWKWDEILFSPCWKQIMFSSIFIDEINKAPRNNTDYLKDKVLPIFLGIQQSFVIKQEKHMERIKSELLEFCWCPSRIEKWKHEMLEPIY